MKKFFLKILFIITAIMLICILLNIKTVQASDLRNIANNGNIDISNSNGTTVDVGNKIFGLVQVCGIIASVIALMLLGIKYITSSIEEKADLKNSIPTYIFGAVLVAIMPVIANLIYSIMQDIK